MLCDVIAINTQAVMYLVWGKLMERVVDVRRWGLYVFLP